MSDKTFETWEEVIVDFFIQKNENAELVYLKKVIKKVNTIYAKEQYYKISELKDFFDTKKNKKEKGQSALEFQRTKALKILRLIQIPDGINKNSLIFDYRSKISDIKEKFVINKWIDQSSKKAASVRFATHIIKLTHSIIDSSSIYDNIDLISNSRLTTSTLKHKILDAVAGNQYAPIFQFLELNFNGEKLVEKLINQDDVTLKSFTDNNSQLITWNHDFSKSMTSSKLSSHSLAKQMYFPINSSQYHLICNIKSSSLAHAIFEYIKNLQPAKEVKKSYDNNKYSDSFVNQLPKQAKINVTGSHHGNASQLNGKRGGQLKLFSTQPPTWQSQLKPPIHKESLFDNLYNSNISEDLDYLSDFLMRFKNLDLSIKNPKRRKHLERWVNSIIDEVFYYINSIQNLTPAWSDTKNIKLKAEHQYLVDPFRDDKSFQHQREDKRWQQVIRTDFARWMNKNLKTKNKEFTPQKIHTKIWKELIEKPLRLDTEDINAVNKHNQKEKKA